LERVPFPNYVPIFGKKLWMECPEMVRLGCKVGRYLPFEWFVVEPLGAGKIVENGSTCWYINDTEKIGMAKRP
jgi:hypothetical protein